MEESLGGEGLVLSNASLETYREYSIILRCLVSSCEVDGCFAPSRGGD